MRSSQALAWFLLVLSPASAISCWDQAGQRYGISPHLLHAIAGVESGLDPRALNLSHRARTGTYDIGLMQINSSHPMELSAQRGRSSSKLESKSPPMEAPPSIPSRKRLSDGSEFQSCRSGSSMCRSGIASGGFMNGGWPLSRQ